ncbi:hypothetical protein [Mixta gaviniae]|uniref:hypothetical protein n=1 Tax=Mixta gaviniae TaxID=665914 RepID=UPI0011B00B50|nr:hypothetical protein [Mixta gaviniae]
MGVAFIIDFLCLIALLRYPDLFQLNKDIPFLKKAEHTKKPERLLRLSRGIMAVRGGWTRFARPAGSLRLSNRLRRLSNPAGVLITPS